MLACRTQVRLGLGGVSLRDGAAAQVDLAQSRRGPAAYAAAKSDVGRLAHERAAAQAERDERGCKSGRSSAARPASLSVRLPRKLSAVRDGRQGRASRSQRRGSASNSTSCPGVALLPSRSRERSVVRELPASHRLCPRKLPCECTPLVQNVGHIDLQAQQRPRACSRAPGSPRI